VAAAQSVIVSWDRSSEPDIAGYRLFFGTESRVYSSHVDVPGPIGMASNLSEGQIYYFAAVSYTSLGFESELSEEISFTPSQHAGGLANLSTRVRVANGDNVLIGGFIITGSGVRTVILRALGPSLAH